MKYQHFLLLVFLFFIILTSPAVADTDNYPPHWDVVQKKQAEKILGDAGEYIYLQVSGEQFKINRDLTGELIALTEEKKGQLNISVQDKGLVEIEPGSLKVENQSLFWQDIELLDIQKYREEDEDFYRENPQYTRQDMLFNGYYYPFKNHSRLISLTTVLCTYIPPPYTPSYTDTIWMQGDQFLRLNTDPGFRLEKVIDNQDGSFWLAGWIKNWKMCSENTLYLVDKTGQVFSINQMLNKNHIEVLGEGLNSVVIRAATQAVNPYFGPDDKKYSSQNQGIYIIDSQGKACKRPEEISDYGQVYLHSNNQLYGLSRDGKKLVNVTEGKVFEVEGKETDYDRLVREINHIQGQEYPKTIRTDNDGSTWIIKDNRIFHIAGGIEYPFNRGLPVMMYPVHNIFIDYEGGKWFLGSAGVAYYGNGYQEALNLNPLLDGGIQPGRYENLYVDGNKRLWFFDRQIKYAPFKESTLLAPENSLILGFEMAAHPYSEIEGQGIFVYQKPNEDGVYTVRILKLNPQGKIKHTDYQIERGIQRYFTREGILYLVTEDGLIKLEGEKRTDIRHQLLNGMSLIYADRDKVIFSHPYRIITIQQGNIIEN